MNTRGTHFPRTCCFNNSSGTRLTPQGTTSPPLQSITGCCADHQGKSASACRCLSTISLLLSELEQKVQPSNYPAKLDSILVFQKEALARSKSVLSCSTCSPRPEYILLLGMVTERLVTVFESTVDIHLDSVSVTQHTSSQAAANASHHHPAPCSYEASKTFFGSYEIETPDEYNRLMSVLLAMQLQTLWRFTAGMKKAGELEASSTPKIQALEKRVVRLLQKIRHFRDEC